MSNLQSTISLLGLNKVWLGAQFFNFPQSLTNIMWMSNNGTHCGAVQYNMSIEFDQNDDYNCILANNNQWFNDDCAQWYDTVCEFGIAMIF